MRWFYVVVAVCAFSVSGFGAVKSLSDHWKDVGLTYADVSDLFETQACYDEERKFLGCVNALNQTLNANSWSLIPASRQSEGFGKVVRDFGSVVVAESQPTPKTGVAAVLKFNREERRKAHGAWVKLFHQGTRTNTREIADWVSQQGFFTKSEPQLAATLLNTVLMVTRDPHTMILPASYVNQSSSGSGENFSGIGAVFRAVNNNGEVWFLVQTPLEGSPALKAGLRAGDRLMKVDGNEVHGLAFSDVVSQIRGPEGTQVVLTVERNSQEKDLSITRGKITVPNVQAKVLASTRRKLGYLKLNSFLRQTGCQEMKSELRALERQGVQGIVLDLRGNGGGLITESVCVSNLFLNPGATVVTTKTNSFLMPTQTLKATLPATTSLPMVTLVDGGSASASEIVSGALQDHQRSLIVGQTTFGKGTVQNQRPLKGGALVIRETIGRFYLPSGRSNQISGVVPDFEAFAVPNPTEDDKVTYREEDEYLAYPGQGDAWKQPRPAVIAQVNGCLSQRSTAETRFKNHQGPLQADYQQYFAEDVLNCAIDLSVPMPMAEAVDLNSLIPPLAFGSR